MQRRTAFVTTLLLFFGLISLPVSLRAAVVEQVIAVVDGEPYTLSNFKDFAKTKMDRDFPQGDLNKIGTEDKEVLEQFITDKLLAAEIKQAGIKISDEEIDQYIRQVKQRNQLSDADLKAALAREGVTLEKYRASIRAEIEKGELIDRQVTRKVNITTEDVERYYRQNTKKYMSRERARLRHILIPLPQGAGPEAVDAALAKANDLRQRAMAGEDFAALARQYSEGAGAAQGGDIGWVTRGSLLKEIEDAAFDKLKVGEVSQPIQTSLGVHLVKLEARDTPQPLPLSAVQAQIKEELYTKAREERYQNWLKGELRRKHRVDVKLPGVVFRPEGTKQKTVDSLVASSASKRKEEDSSFLSYLNPLSYIFKSVPIEGEDAEGEPSGRNIVSVFGVPLFATETAGDVPDDPLAPIDLSPKQGGAAPKSGDTTPKSADPAPKSDQKSADQKSKDSGGFFSSVLDTLNPFSK